MDTLTGSIERITYYNPENGYTVLRLRPEHVRGIQGLSREGLATVVGNLPELNPGEHLQIKGHWTNHPKHGTQFNAEICEQATPVTATGIRRYLGSGLVKGIGPEMAGRITAMFGEKTLDIIEDHPEKLLKVPGIGPARAKRISEAFQEQKSIRDVMLFLQTHGVSPTYAFKIFKRYGRAAIEVVTRNPYRLATEIRGVGFRSADKIAGSLGVDLRSPLRAQAGILYVLDMIQSEGHVYYPRSKLLDKSKERSASIFKSSEALWKSYDGHGTSP